MARRRRTPTPIGTADLRALDDPDFRVYWARGLTRHVLAGRYGLDVADALRHRLAQVGDDPAAVTAACEDALRDLDVGALERARRNLTSTLCAGVRFQRSRGRRPVPAWKLAAAAALEDLYPPHPQPERTT